MPRKQQTIVLSLGGSLIAPPGGIDTAFIKKFRDLIHGQVRKGKRFVIICGGGRLSRDYQAAAAKVTKLTRDDLDWLGIHATRLNAHLLRTVFRTKAHPRIITDPHEDIHAKEPIVIGAGWRPGCSTDYDAVLLARRFSADTVVNLSNIDYVYDADPRKNPKAKKLKAMSWADFRKMVGSAWDPGLNSPFDPVASKLADELGLTVVIANGKKMANVGAILNGAPFKGTVIS